MGHGLTPRPSSGSRESSHHEGAKILEGDQEFALINRQAIMSAIEMYNT
jgi:hypothetical protein